MLGVITRKYRPDIHKKNLELRNFSYANWENQSVLKRILGELNFRKTTPAIQLKNKIEKRLEELELENRKKLYLRQLKTNKNSKNSESFPWVSTEVGFGFEKIDVSGWKKNDLLSKMGYKTGNYSDLNIETRRAILYKVYKEEIPKKIANLFEDIESWGIPNSSTRLRKIAESIALVIRNEKMHSYDYTVSISERESDLADLKKKYYDGKYNI